MGGNNNAQSLCTLEHVPPVPGQPARLPPPAWRGPLSDLNADALAALWAEALAYSRSEIARYAIWRDSAQPVLADGYDAESLVQAAFERLLLQRPTCAATTKDSVRRRCSSTSNVSRLVSGRL
jgi:hypothetical protein